MKAQRLGCAHSLHITWWKLRESLFTGAGAHLCSSSDHSSFFPGPSCCRWKSDHAQPNIKTMSHGENIWTTVGPVFEHKDKMKQQLCFDVIRTVVCKYLRHIKDRCLQSGWLVFTKFHWPFVKPGSLCHCTDSQYFFFFPFSVHVCKRKERERGGALLRLTWSCSFPRPATSTQGVYLAETQRGGTKKRLKTSKSRPQRRKMEGCAVPFDLIHLWCYGGLLTPQTYIHSQFL